MAREYHHLYNRRAWKQLREAHLRGDPVCRMHKAIGQLVPAEVVDHITPHKGDLARFYDAANLQSLCKACHDGHKQAQERNVDGLLRGAGHDGMPLDLAHPWHCPPASAMAPPAAASTAQPQGIGRAAIEPPAASTGPAHPIAGRGRGGRIPVAATPQTALVTSFARPQNG